MVYFHQHFECSKVDLFYVAVVSQLSQILHVQTINNIVLADFILASIIIWQTWVVFTLHTNRFHANDLLHRLFIYVTICLVTIMTVNCDNIMAPDPDVNTGMAFMVAYLLVRLQYIFAYLYHMYRKNSTK